MTTDVSPNLNLAGDAAAEQTRRSGNVPPADAGKGLAANDTPRQTSDLRAGIAYGVAAYLWWGLCPIYFKAVAHVPALEVLAHRIVWSILLLSLLVRRYGRWPAVFAMFRDGRALMGLCGSTILLACNWFTFIYAIAANRLLEASLGYFINPLVNVLLGFLFLGERLRRWQKISVALAAVGVSFRAIDHGSLPVIALILATSFGFYGLLRKKGRADALVGLSVETTLLGPLALIWLLYLTMSHRGSFGVESRTLDLLLILAGVITAVPLLWFANAARRLRLATVGFLQYLAPSLQFLLAVAIYGEVFSGRDLIAFCFIWAALTIYSVDAARYRSAVRR